MIIDTHTYVVSSDKVKHPLDPGARGWSTEVSNNVEDLIAEMDRAGVDCATLVQPNATYGLSSRAGGYLGQVQLGQTALPWLSDDDRRWIMGETAHTLWPMLQGPAGG